MLKWLLYAITFTFTVPGTAQVVHYPLQSSLEDIVGDQDGTNHGVTFGTDPERGEVALFDGNGYANIPSFLQGREEVTVAVWYKMEEVRPWSRIYNFGNGDQIEPKDVFMLIPVNGQNQQLRFTYSKALADEVWLDLDVPTDVAFLTTDTWYHSVVTVTEESLVVYHNGYMAGGSRIQRSVTTVVDTSNALGKSFWPDPLWAGAMSDLRIYDRALDTSEVRQLFEATSDITGTNDFFVDNFKPQIFYDGQNLRVDIGKAITNESLSIYTTDGRLQQRGTLLSAYPFTPLSSGIYLIQLWDQKRVYTTRLFLSR